MADPFPVPGSRGRKELTGIVSISLEYIIEGPADDGGDEPWGLLTTWAPDSFPLGLDEVDREFTKEDNGDWRLTITCEGLPTGSADETGAIIEIDHSSVEDPIESFPKFEGDNGLAKKYNAQYLDGQKFDGFARKIKDPASGQMAQNPLYGTSYYFNDNPILRVTFTARQYKTDYLKNICKIDTSLVPQEGQAYLEAPDGKTWLKKSVKGRFRGNTWEFTIEWALGLWVPDIYSAPSI